GRVRKGLLRPCDEPRRYAYLTNAGDAQIVEKVRRVRIARQELDPQVVVESERPSQPHASADRQVVWRRNRAVEPEPVSFEHGEFSSSAFRVASDHASGDSVFGVLDLHDLLSRVGWERSQAVDGELERETHLIADRESGIVPIAEVPVLKHGRQLHTARKYSERQMGRSAAAAPSRLVRNTSTRSTRAFHAADVRRSGLLGGRLRQGIFLPKYGSY